MEKSKKSYTRAPFTERCLLAHDLNNDLNVILGRCELLGEFLQKDSEASKHLRLIQEAAYHMANRIAERPCHVAVQRGIAERRSPAGGPGSSPGVGR